MSNTRSIRALLFTFIFFICVGWARLFYLQIVVKEHFKQLSTSNFTRLEKIYAPRGNITDRYGHILATNKPIIELYWHPTGKRTLTEHQHAVLETLAAITHQPFTSEETLKKIIRAEQLEHTYLLMRNVPFACLSCITEQLGHEPNLMIKSSFRRFYPYKKLASHAIGYLTHHDIEPNGTMGLEKILHDTLRGEPGLTRKTVNAIGKSLLEEEARAVTVGTTIQTTLDSSLQHFAEESFPPHWSGCFVAMQPETGALRAFLSSPTFDPSLFLDAIPQETWQTLIEKRPFLNRICEACYPPASLFKLVTVAAALETHVAHRETSCTCKGYYTFCKRRYHCNNREGHGPVTFKEALALSCNIIFFDVARKLSIDTLAEYARRFGLGQHTGILFPEKTGLIPTSAWKRITKGEPWWPGETLSAAIGQSYLLVTPLQVVRMISAIFTGYLVKPRLLENESIEKSCINIQPSTLAFLKEAMKETVESGTGQRLRDIEDIEIYAKTGTAQISSIGNRYLNSQLREHAWLVAYIRHKDADEPLTLAILVEHGGGSRAPALIAQQFLNKYREHITNGTIDNEPRTLHCAP
jgi:penicillin-binding protein 2